MVQDGSGGFTILWALGNHNTIGSKVSGKLGMSLAAFLDGLSWIVSLPLFSVGVEPSMDTHEVQVCYRGTYA